MRVAFREEACPGEAVGACEKLSASTFQSDPGSL